MDVVAMMGWVSFAAERNCMWLKKLCSVGALSFSLISSEACAGKEDHISGDARGIGLRVQSEMESEKVPDEPNTESDKPFQDIELPPVERASDIGEEISHSSRIYVRNYLFAGNSVFSDEELSGVVGHYLGRYVSSEELQALRHVLTQYYISRGYVISGAFIPNQEVEGGEVTVQLVEGRLSRLEVKGNNWLRSSYIRNRIMLNNSGILNVGDLTDSLHFLKLDSLVGNMRGELVPGEVLGEWVLNVEVEEEENLHFAVVANNHRSPNVGENRLEIHAGHHNVSGFGDAINVRYGVTEGLTDVYVAYAFPINPRNTRIGIGYSKSDSIVVERPFDDLDIESDLEGGELYLLHPLYKAFGEEVELEFKVERRRSKTYLLGVPFSFSPGVDEGRSSSTVMRISQKWLKRRATNILAAESRLTIGVDALGATVNDNEPDGQFLAWLGQFQWVQRFRLANSVAVFRFDTQLSEDALLPMEKFSVGGANSVRGYQENWLVRDNGWAASVEQRFPLRLNKYVKRPHALELAFFVDAGRGWNRWDVATDLETLSSVGVGVRYESSEKLHAGLYWGKALTATDDGSGDLQSQGIHFQVNLTLI